MGRKTRRGRRRGRFYSRERTDLNVVTICSQAGKWSAARGVDDGSACWRLGKEKEGESDSGVALAVLASARGTGTDTFPARVPTVMDIESARPPLRQ